MQEKCLRKFSSAGTCFLRIAGKPQKLEPAKFRATRYIKPYETTFQNPQSTSNCPFVPFLYLTCYLDFSERFERLHSLFMNNNIFQAEICENLRI